MKITINLHQGYDVIIEPNILDRINDYIDFNHQVLVVLDNNVNKSFIKNLNSKAIIYNFDASEENKSFDSLKAIIDVMISNNFSRHDYLVAVGGGVTGDLVGFCASIYKRGCNFINIPTTTLSMIDSAVGGKVAINYQHLKNVVGSFYQPKVVLIDLNVLSTLPKRHYYNGLVEALKMGLTLDKSLYQLFTKDELQLEEIIIKSVNAKRKIVEADEKELGIRKVLNFGHTIGHAIESLNFGKVYHGEAVAVGMLFMIDNDSLKQEVAEILRRMNINLDLELDKNQLKTLIANDKKANLDYIDGVILNDLEDFTITKLTLEEIINRMDGNK